MCEFLVGRGIPDEIVQLPQRVLNTLFSIFLLDHHQSRRTDDSEYCEWHSGTVEHAQTADGFDYQIY